MKYLATLLLILGFGLSAFGQTIKSLGYNTTNGQVVANTGTNKLNFTNHVAFGVDGIETYQAGFRGYGVSLNLEERVIEDVGLVDPAVIGWSGGNYIDLGLPLFFPNTTNAAITRTNLGLGWSALTNSNSATSLIGVTTNGQVVANTTNTLTFTNAIAIYGTAQINTIEPYGGGSGISILDGIIIDTNGVGGEAFSWGSGVLAMGVPISFATTNIAATTRTNLGLGWSALTNSNSGIGLVSVNSNGTVVSPANFWSNAPISSVIDLSTTNATGVLPIVKGGTGGTNSNTALTNLGIFPAFAAVVVGGSNVTGGNTVVGSGATADDGSGLGGVAIGRSVVVSNSAIGVGYAAVARDISGGTGIGGVAVGYQATNISSGGASIGYRAQATNGGAVGKEATAFNGFAGGDQAKANAVNAVQLGTGTLTNSNSIQFLNAGAVDTNEWNALANASTLGRFTLTNSSAESLRNEIGLGATNTVTFSNVVNNGNFTNNNGTIYGLKTNVGPFEGIGNFFASNNTTVGNETLFRVGVAETTNKSAQFGFRVARTNNGGEGLAVFSVFGYNALMMIGPSDRSRSNSLTNTNAAIEADIWTMSETNRVMTLRDTNTGAMVMHRPIGINTDSVNTNVPSNTTNVAGWIEFYVGTNSVRVPYYQ